MKLPKGNKSQKNKLSLPALSIVVLGLLTAIGIYQLVSKETVEVLVPSEKIEARTEVTAEMFTYKVVDAESVPKDAYLRGQESELNNKITSTLLVPDLPVVPDMFLGEDVKSSLTSAVPEGKVIFTLAVDDVQGVSAKISKNDRVNIYSTVQSDLIGFSTKLIYQNVEVVDTKTSEEGTLSSVTLALTPEEAEEVIYAYEAGTLHLAVVPYEYKETTTDGMTDLQFVRKNVNNTGIPLDDGSEEGVVIHTPDKEEQKEASSSDGENNE